MTFGWHWISFGVPSAILMPYPVEVSTTVDPEVVTVVVTTEVAVVEAVQPVHVVQGAEVDHEDSVQPAIKNHVSTCAAKCEMRTHHSTSQPDTPSSPTNSSKPRSSSCP